jgi:hypothetical protein
VRFSHFNAALREPPLPAKCGSSFHNGIGKNHITGIFPENLKLAMAQAFPEATGDRSHAAGNYFSWLSNLAIWLSVGRGPQGGKIVSVPTDGNPGIPLSQDPSQVSCRPADPNFQANFVSGRIEGEYVPVMHEEFNPGLINYNVIRCRIGDFDSGSYNLSVFMNTKYGRDSSFYGGLAYGKRNVSI